jgi:hypothetical protein
MNSKVAWIFQYLLYKSLIMKHVTKKPGKPHKEEAPKDRDHRSQRQDEPRQDEPKGLTKEDLPDATNESTGAMGSGQRQDSN